MDKRLNWLRLSLFSFVIISLGVLTSNVQADAPSSNLSEAQDTSGKAEGSDDIKERAISAPNLPGGLSKEELRGVNIRGDQVNALPGYVLERGPGKNQVSARRAGSPGGVGAKLDCVCVGQHGVCDASASGDVAVCTKSPTAPCSGSCTFKAGVTSGSRPLLR
jgi:hypothetical protein